MKKSGRAWIVAGLAAAVLLAGGAVAWKRWVEAIRFISLRGDKEAYLHYDIVELRLATRDGTLNRNFEKAPPSVVVTRGGEPLETVAGIKEMTLTRAPTGIWIARWPVPWNAEPGEYVPMLLGREDLKERLHVTPFHIGRRVPKSLPKGFVVATLESVSPLSSMRVLGPDGVKTDWHGLLDWAKDLGADAFMVLGGQSPGINAGETWVTTNLKMLPIVAKECHARGLKFGTYAMYSLTMSKTVKIPGYEYGLEIKDAQPVVTRAVSVREHKRLDDVVAFLKPFADDPNVDFVGVDYIRNALGGYEMVDDFVADMPGVAVPPEWAKLDKTERMTWLARKKIMRKDMNFVDAWQWWRAHRVALVVKELRERLGDKKPLWAFTLTWDKGWHHGQDAVMMNDAGIDMDALMFYEADKPQFNAMLSDWHKYVKRGDVRLAPGNIFDWGLHQKDPAGPEEFGRRLKRAIDDVYGDGPADAVFYHDIARLLWGRLGPWGTRPWADEARKISRYVKSRAASENAP